MHVARAQKKTCSYTFPRQNLRNHFCIKCKHQFFVRAFAPLSGLLPLLLQCGHAICDQCAKNYSNQPCPLCNVISQCENDNKAPLELSVYAIGMVATSNSRPTQDETDISFVLTSNSKVRQQSTQGLCHECGIQAAVKCQQCCVLLCRICYSKIHGKALNHHTKIILSESGNECSFFLRTSCSETCKELLSYYCTNCEMASCSHCMLHTHAKHNYVPLLKKNQELLPEFQEVSERVIESLHRVRQSQKKLKTLRVFPAETEDSENVAASITQHFNRLHGVLQNIEKKITDALYEQRDFVNKNRNEIFAQLKKQEEQLRSAYAMMHTVRDNLDKIDIHEVNQKLEELAAMPCHLVQDPVSEDQKIAFTVDNSIIAALEEHCTVKTAPVSGFSLLPTELLPDDYEMEPLTQGISIPRFLEQQLVSVNQPPPSEVTLVRRKTTCTPIVGTSGMVFVTHVVDPSCFYVQMIANINRINELTKELATTAKNAKVMLTEVVFNGLYIVQKSTDKEWYRGRITSIKTVNDVEMYEVLFVDFGTREENVPLTRIRLIPTQYAILPIMAIKCSLYEIVPVNGKWSKDATEAFKKVVSGNALISMHLACVSGDTYYVDLHTVSEKDSGLASVRDMLTYLRFGSCVSSHKLMRINPDSTRKYFKDTLEMEAYTEVEIKYIVSPSCIYVEKVRNNRTYFRKFINDMIKDYESNMCTSGFIHVPEKDTPCVARGSHGWQRGIITDVPSESTVRVFFVDMGYTLELNYDDIRSIPQKYMSCKTQVIRIALRHIKPLPTENQQWDLKATNFLHDFLQKAGNRCKIVAFDKYDETYSVCMYTIDNTNVASALVNNGHAIRIGSNASMKALRKRRNKPKKVDSKEFMHLKDPNETFKSMESKPEQEPELYDMSTTMDMKLSKNDDPFKVSVTVLRVESPDCIFVADESCQESHVEMTTRIQDFYNTYGSASGIWSNGSTCVVYSNKDKLYLRARIVDFKSEDEVVVFFYDTGFEETVTFKDIQSLYSEFTTVPAYLFKIKLAGILPCGGSTVWPMFSCDKLQDIINQNQNFKFYISKLEEEDTQEDSAIPVELWVKQRITDGALAPTRIEINSVNRMLVENGAALPIKDYARKRDKILAVELKRQLQRRLEMKSKQDTNVKWYKINDDDNDRSFFNLNPSENASKYSPTLLSDSTLDDYDADEIFDLAIPPKYSVWLPPVPILENQFVAIPTNLDFDCALYLHTKQGAKRLGYIESRLNEFYKDVVIEECDKDWSPGDMCIAQYHANKKWYRGKVESVQENGVINVVFIDYGNVEECKVGTIKKKIILGHIPIQCTKCIIHGLYPASKDGKWTTDELDKIHSLLIEEECEVTVLERTDTHLVVSLMLLPNKKCDRKCDLITFLINVYRMDLKSNVEMSIEDSSHTSVETADVVIENHNILYEYQNGDGIISGNSVLFHHDEHLDDDVINDIPDIENLSWSQVQDQLISSTIQIGSQDNLTTDFQTINFMEYCESIEVELCEPINLIQFYAHLKENAHCPAINKYYKQYQQMMNDIQEYACKQPKLANPAKNTPCCAKFDDDVWYRCVIVDIDKTQIELFYVDFGNFGSKEVNLDGSYELYDLKPEWLKVPIMAVKCQLWNIDFNSDFNKQQIFAELRGMYDGTVIAKAKDHDEEFVYVEIYKDKESKEVMYSTALENNMFRYKLKMN